MRMVLSRFLGAEGIGLFQVTGTFFMGFVIPIVAGLYPATSRAVASRSDGRRSPHTDRTLKLSACLGLVASGLGIALSFFVRPPTLEARDALPTRIMAFMLGIASLYTSVEAFFIGIQDARPVILAEQVQEVVRLAGILSALTILRGAAIGLQLRHVFFWSAVAEGVGFVLLAAAYTRIEWVYDPEQHPRRASSNTTLSILRELVRDSLPISVTRILNSALRIAEVSMVPLALCRAGHTMHGALAAYGQVTGMAVPAILIPGILTVSLATSLVPEMARGTTREIARKIRLAGIGAFLFGIVTSWAFIAFSGQIAGTLYGDACDPSVLSVTAPLAPALFTDQVTSAALRGLGWSGAALLSDAVAGVLRLFMMVRMTASPTYGVKGVALAIISSSAISAVINVLALWWYFHKKAFGTCCHRCRPS